MLVSARRVVGRVCDVDVETVNGLQGPKWQHLLEDGSAGFRWQANLEPLSMNPKEPLGLTSGLSSAAGLVIQVAHV